MNQLCHSTGCLFWSTDAEQTLQDVLVMGSVIPVEHALGCVVPRYPRHKDSAVLSVAAQQLLCVLQVENKKFKKYLSQIQLSSIKILVPYPIYMEVCKKSSKQ